MMEEERRRRILLEKIQGRLCTGAPRIELAYEEVAALLEIAEDVAGAVQELPRLQNRVEDLEEALEEAIEEAKKGGEKGEPTDYERELANVARELAECRRKLAAAREALKD